MSRVVVYVTHSTHHSLTRFFDADKLDDMDKNAMNKKVKENGSLFNEYSVPPTWHGFSCKDVGDYGALEYLLYSTSPMHREAQHLTFRISENRKNMEIIVSRKLLMDTLSSVFILGKHVILGNMVDQTLNNRPFKVLRYRLIRKNYSSM